MNKIELKIRTECTNCAGEGVVPSKFWERHNNRVIAFKKETGAYPSDETERSWLRETGKDYQKIPEEIDCPECEGSGKMESWISFQDLKDKVNEL